MASIVELIDAFHGNKISAEDYLSGLDRHIQFATRKLTELDRQRIVPEDQKVWDEELKPGLQAAYEGMIGAATEAKEFAKNRDEEILKGVGILIAGIQHVMNLIEKGAGKVSDATLQVLEEATNLNNDGLELQTQAVKGSAESQVSFLD